MGKFKVVEFYECEHCMGVYESEEMVKIHLKECLMNAEDVHTCVGCKHAVLNLVAPSDRDNGYTSLRLQDVLGVKAYLSCGKNIYNGKLTEEKIMREDKQCYSPKEIGERFPVEYTEGYIRYKGIMEQADIEQKEIDEEILEYHKLVAEMKEQNLTQEEMQEILNDKYGDA